MACNNTKRGPNFSHSEIEKLVQLVKLHWSIINNKGTDAATNASKIDAWKAIERAFNQDETCNIYRPHYVLRTKFDNLKRLRKKNPAQKVPKSNEDSVPTNDADDDCFESFRSAIPEPVEFGESFTRSSLRPNVAAFFRESEEKYFIKEMDHYANSADGENEEEFEWHRVSIRNPNSEAQNSDITQSTEELLSKKRKYNDSQSPSKGYNAIEFNDLRKKAFLEKHNLTLQLLKKEAEQRMKHESLLQDLREEELRLRIQLMKDKHEAEISSKKADLT